MKVSEIQRELNAQLLVGKDMDMEILSACGCDLMSDVLAFVKDKAALLTGLVNPHVIRTAEMLDVNCIVFVRGKMPDEDVLEMARARDMMILTTEYTLYEACGKLYMKGVRGTVRREA